MGREKPRSARSLASPPPIATPPIAPPQSPLLCPSPPLPLPSRPPSRRHLHLLRLSPDHLLRGRRAARPTSAPATRAAGDLRRSWHGGAAWGGGGGGAPAAEPAAVAPPAPCSSSALRRPWRTATAMVQPTKEPNGLEDFLLPLPSRAPSSSPAWAAATTPSWPISRLRHGRAVAAPALGTSTACRTSWAPALGTSGTEDTWRRSPDPLMARKSKGRAGTPTELLGTAGRRSTRSSGLLCHRGCRPAAQEPALLRLFFKRDQKWQRVVVVLGNDERETGWMLQDSMWYENQDANATSQPVYQA
nr:uncharacterized protein LOC127317308 isoform X2 [Lolium perenne]